MAAPVEVKAVELELDNFKSFASRTVIPLREGFTTISGPNGSGKSNILDGIMFVLGVSSTRALRASRLPDLINQSGRRREASVRLVLEVKDESDAPRRLEFKRIVRVRGDGEYSGSYYLDGRQVPLSAVHDELERLRIGSSGSNIILQGDVTSLISMSPVERRRIIDDLAGVAAFDRKAAQAEHELSRAEAELGELSLLAEQLRVRLEELEREKEAAALYVDSAVRLHALRCRRLELERTRLEERIRSLDEKSAAAAAELSDVRSRFPEVSAELAEARRELAELERRVRSEAEIRRFELLEERERIRSEKVGNDVELGSLRTTMESRRRSLEALEKEAAALGSRLERLRAMRDESLQRSEELERLASEVSRELERLQATLSEAGDESAVLSSLSSGKERLAALRTELEALRTREEELRRTLVELERECVGADAEWESVQTALSEQSSLVEDEENTVEALRNEFASASARMNGLKWENTERRKRLSSLEQEYRRIEREYHREEARRAAGAVLSGEKAVALVVGSGIKGVHGTVAQLLEVPERYALACEAAAGRRLSNVVVEDEDTARRCIELLKREKAGRVTFLPLSRLNAAPPVGSVRFEGAIDYLFRLVGFKPRYERVAAYVFGSTVLMRSLEEALACGTRFRMVTVDGEVLERSGAVTGGHMERRRGSFAGDLERKAARMRELEGGIRMERARVEESERELETLRERMERTSSALAEMEKDLSADKVRLEQLQERAMELGERRKSLARRLEETRGALEVLCWRRGEVEESLHACEAEVRSLEEKAARARSGAEELERARRELEELHERRVDLLSRRAKLEERRVSCESEYSFSSSRLEAVNEEISSLRESLERDRSREQELLGRREELERRLEEMDETLARMSREVELLHDRRSELERRVAGLVETRSRLESGVRILEERLKSLDEKKRSLESELRDVVGALRTEEEEFAGRFSPLGVRVEESLRRASADCSCSSLKALKEEEERLRSVIAGLGAVNMLALTQYDEVRSRWSDLDERRSVVEREIGQLRERILSLGRRKVEAFMEAFCRVKANYVSIYEELSGGEADLILEDEEDPFAGGLVIKATPAGKRMARMEALSGGEKSLCALAFVFAYQSYRPAPFYVFDEVDMFLDGRNTERLASMIRRHSRKTQFIVVSLRKAMIERSDWTIGVTMGRNGASRVTGVAMKAARALSPQNSVVMEAVP